MNLSNVFNLDNEVPTVQLTSTPVSETSFTLTATASDNNKSGIAKYEFYANGVKVDTKTTTEETATYTWNGTEMEENKECYVIVYDRIGNSNRRNITARTLLYTWERWNRKTEVYYTYLGQTRITDYTNRSSFPSGTMYADYSFSSEKGFTGTGKSEYNSGSSASNSNCKVTNTKVERTSHQRTNINGKFDYSIEIYECERHQDYVKGTTKYDPVYSKDSDAYPVNNYVSSYWYISKGLG